MRLYQVRSIAALLLAAPLWASAQVGVSASFVSNYRVRGITLSDDAPAAQLAINVDSDSGLYAGAMASQARLRYTAVDALTLAYAGYARRLDDNWSWEAGISQSSFHHGSNYNYREVFAGISTERLSLRYAQSPRYFGVGEATGYAEINGSFPLTGQVDLVGHAGYLRSLGGREGRYYTVQPRSDTHHNLKRSGPETAP
ncbi:MAG: TorF family putative porin [Pseudomonadota bacterium]